MTCIAPLAIPHYITGDINVDGIHLPKGTLMMPNLHRITRNPKVFPDPNSFKPERFLDSNGQFMKNEHNIPFSIGKVNQFNVEVVRFLMSKLVV